MTAGLSLTLGPGQIATAWKHLFRTCSTITENCASFQKRKHEQDTKRRSSNKYKCARIEKHYHLTPSSADKDYGAEAVMPNTINQ